jgi:raffinose/stachyose/melibiose transport system permease protein
MKKKNYSQWIMFALVSILIILYVSPLYFSLISAFKSNGEIMRDPTAMPKSWLNFDNFIFLFSKTRYPQAFVNSTILTVTSEIAILFLIPMTSYGIARGNKKITPIIYTLFLSAMMIPFQVYMIPLFKELKTMHLFGTMAGPVVIYLSGSIPFGILLFTSFLKNIPIEIEEAATIDGCGPFHTFWRIIFPLLKPVTATMIILNGLGIWNDFLMPMLVLPSNKAKTVNVEIFSFIDQFSSRWDVVFAGVICGLIPVFIVFVTLQKYFVKGLTSGAAKG